MLKPWKLPVKAWSPPSARSELRKAKLPGLAGSKKPAGRSWCPRRFILLWAVSASSQPAPRPIRGSLCADTDVAPKPPITAAATTTPSTRFALRR